MFLGRSYLSMLTSPDEDLPATEQLQRDHFGMHRFIWPDADGAVEFALTHGDMIRLLRDSGFEVKGLVEVQAPEGAETPATSARDGGVVETLADRGGLESTEGGLTTCGARFRRSSRGGRPHRGDRAAVRSHVQCVADERAHGASKLVAFAVRQGKQPIDALRPTVRTAPSPGSKENNPGRPTSVSNARRDLREP